MCYEEESITNQKYLRSVSSATFLFLHAKLERLENIHSCPRYTVFDFAIWSTLGPIVM